MSVTRLDAHRRQRAARTSRATAVRRVLRTGDHHDLLELIDERGWSALETCNALLDVLDAGNAIVLVGDRGQVRPWHADSPADDEDLDEPEREIA